MNTAKLLVVCALFSAFPACTFAETNDTALSAEVRQGDTAAPASLIALAPPAPEELLSSDNGFSTTEYITLADTSNAVSTRDTSLPVNTSSILVLALVSAIATFFVLQSISDWLEISRDIKHYSHRHAH